MCGLVAALAAMGIGQLFSGFTFPAASPVVAVGEAAIDHTPLAVKDWATATFGTADKTVLLGGVLVVVLLYSVLVGILAMRRFALGLTGLAIFAALGLAAALTRHGASGSYAVPTLFGAIAGALVLRWMVVNGRKAAQAQLQAQPRAARAAAGTGKSPETAFAGGKPGAEAGDALRPRPAADDGDPGAPARATQASAVPERTRPPESTSDEAAGDEAAGDNKGRSADGTVGDDETSNDDSVDDDSVGWVAASGGTPAVAGRPASANSVSGNRVSWASDFRAGPPVMRPGGPGREAATARRSFLVAGGVSVAAAAVGTIAGRVLSERKNVSLAQQAIRLPRAAQPVKPLPAGVNLPVPGISPFISPNSQFYRVDTAILIPQVDPSNWQLRIHGMVAREITVTFDELLHRPLIEDYLTLTCVSNPVGGPYVGNAKWLGASLAALLREARPQRGADQLLATSSDGFTSGTPLSVVLDGRDALVAVGMNGTTLPTEHGFPARLVVPGLYGYVSACKWVVDLEVTTFAAAQGYWVPRGWSVMGPIKTESRIDVPVGGSTVKAGKVPVAGVAWAQHKGIDAVEARADNGPWQQATLAAVPGIDTWQQWVWEWDATPGTHVIEARATDKSGYTQTSQIADVAPNGASGYPSTQVTVS